MGASEQTSYTMGRYTRLLLAVYLLLCLLLAGVRGQQQAADVVAPAAAPAVLRPDCEARCGDLEVPYPFGISDECAINAGFRINCTVVDTASGGVKRKRPLMGPFEVTKISVSDNKAWMKLNISWYCYDSRVGRMTHSIYYQNFTYSYFRLSDADNKIFVIGCNTLAYMRSASYVVGCSSTCDQLVGGEQQPRNGGGSGTTCSGNNGCCELDVPSDMAYFDSYFNEAYNSTSMGYGRCGYVVVMEKAAFTYNTSYFFGDEFWNAYQGNVPSVWDWVVTWENSCQAAKTTNTTPYACVSSNSECIDYASNWNGYRCNCSKGYHGNPYVKGGCIDIDECLDNATYPCTGICKNTPGSFTCSCPRTQRMIDGGVCIPRDKSIWMRPVVGASVGLVVLVVVIACACLTLERRKLQLIKQKYFKQHGGLLLFEEIKSQQGMAFRIFLEEELKQATNGFDEQHVLGHGSHGTVYKGLLKGDSEVAIKKCMTIDEQQRKEFGKEMMILSQINHRNIVKLLGCCLEVEVPILVYEFIANDTVFNFIHGRRHHIPLATRLRIAHESAEALAYLHSCASPPILHGDVKSSNILLDRDFTAKVSDFGASILAPTDESQFVTIVQGTCGYLDPEYMQTCQLTDKSDVYSFGVVLLELITGMKPFNLQALEYEKSLSMRFLSAMKENKLEDMVDDAIKNDEDMALLEEVAELAAHCLEMCGINRPSMKEVADKLDRLRKVMQHPWAQQSPQEMESLLGETSSMSSSVLATTENFSIEKKAIKGLESGR